MLNRRISIKYIVPFVAVLLLVVIMTLRPTSDLQLPSEVEQSVPEVSKQDLVGAPEVLAAHIIGALRHQQGTARLTSPDSTYGPVYLAFRSKGLLQASHWEVGDDWEASIQRAVQALWQYIDESTTIEVVLTYGYEPVNLRRDRQKLTNVHRGVRGVELRLGDSVMRFGPTDMIARNLSFDNAIDRFGKSRGVDTKGRERGRIRTRMFEAEQYLVQLGSPVEVIRLFRGARLVPMSDVTKSNVEHLADSMAEWLANQVNDNGRMTYRYFPSRGTESNANNLIRQFMATIALGRVARKRNDEAMLDLVDKNLNYNFKTFYRTDGHLGYVEKDNKVKLGAVALAALALVEHPRKSDYVEIQNSMHAMVEHLWQSDGSFKTWYKPAHRRDQQNFYPGEALLFWATLYQENPQPELLERFMKSFRYYRKWHREYRNPAFVPWHTQAYYLVWERYQDPELAEFIFEMNDWLLSMQEWEDAVYEDTRGRFYDASRPFYGPPHASSTGVYLEGLIDAYKLAKTFGDSARQHNYRVAILRGLRSVMQLQFKDEVDMYYISKRENVEGGIRTRVYDNTIRIDNVQHNLIAVLKILEEFSYDDYRL